NAPARCAATATVYGHRTLHSGHPNGATSSLQWGRLNGELSQAQGGAMRQETLVQHKISMFVSSVLALLLAMTATPTDTRAGEAKLQRLIFASAGIDERLVRHKISMFVSSVLALLLAMTATPTDTRAGEAKLQRLIFASAGIDE